MLYLALDMASKISQPWQWDHCVHWKRFNHSISMQLESKFSLQNGAQDKLIWSSPVISYSFLRAKQPFRTICWKQNVPLLGLGGETNHPFVTRINTAAESTNTNMKEHNLTVCLILGFWVFLSLSMSSELFQNIFSAGSATVDIFRNSFLLCHSATDWKKGKGKASFQRDACSVCFNEINMLVSTYSGLGLFCELRIRRTSYHYKHLKIIL